jgi:hypothetical protein
MKKQRTSSNPTFLKVFPCNWTRIERVERAVVLFAVVVLLLDLFVWRPN